MEADCPTPGPTVTEWLLLLGPMGLVLLFLDSFRCPSSGPGGLVNWNVGNK